MKKIWSDILCAAILGLVVPWLLLNGFVTHNRQQPPSSIPPESSALTDVFLIPVLMDDGQPVHMELDDYLTGVVLEEMPDEFEPEAQKAQAVVARTYALRTFVSGSKHPGGAVCTESSCCQGFRSREDYLARGGTEEGFQKIQAAVAATSGQVLTYDGKLIEATYFSSSGGKTEDALAVWGSDVPYLQSTDSPEDGFSQRTLASVTFTAEEFCSALGVSLSGSAATWLGDVTYTAGGGVDTMVIGGVTYKGTTLRRLLGLRSTAFTMSAVGDHITVTTRGYGHRVGMSQYGAEAMAVQGKTYDQILAHYYKGTVLTDWIDNMEKLG
jgi:stage II sporulation protein D